MAKAGTASTPKKSKSDGPKAGSMPMRRRVLRAAGASFETRKDFRTAAKSSGYATRKDFIAGARAAGKNLKDFAAGLPGAIPQPRRKKAAGTGKAAG